MSQTWHANSQFLTDIYPFGFFSPWPWVWLPAISAGSVGLTAFQVGDDVGSYCGGSDLDEYPPLGQGPLTKSLGRSFFGTTDFVLSLVQNWVSGPS